MQLRQIANEIGISNYDPALDLAFQSLPNTDTPACDLQLIHRLQEDWDLFGEYFDLVKTLANQINQDQNRSTWIKAAASYAISVPLSHARKIPVPTEDGTAVTAMLPLYILLPMIPLSIADYRRRGFSEQEIHIIMQGFVNGIRDIHQQTGMPGIDKHYYTWLMIFAKTSIFHVGGLQFELRQLPKDVLYLKHIPTGQITPVMNQGMIHHTGINILGSAGFADAAGAFEATFTQDENSYYGYACVNSRIHTQKQAFPKDEWQIFLKPGDDCLGIHIPTGADISPEALNRCTAEALQITAARYPEHHPGAIYGSSWILDPQLLQIVGADSKIGKLLNRFIKHPKKCDGTSVFSCVFDKIPERYEDLMDNTTLRRGLKKLYLEGGYNHKYAGIMIDPLG